MASAREPPRPPAAQDPRVVSLFEVIGAYFTDIVFNKLYRSAALAAERAGSLTEAYIGQVSAYVAGLKGDRRCYSSEVQEVHAYFTRHTSLSMLTFTGFVDRVVQVCVPDDFFRRLAAAEKDELFGSIVCGVVADLAAYATRPDVLRRVIDEHERSPQVTIRMLQDEALRALTQRRFEIQNRFLRRAGQATAAVSAELYEAIRAKLCEVVREKAKAVFAARKASRRARSAERALARAQRREARFVEIIALLRRGAPARPPGPGSDESGSDESGSEESGSDESGSDESGSGTDGSEPEEEAPPPPPKKAAPPPQKKPALQGFFRPPPAVLPRREEAPQRDAAPREAPPPARPALSGLAAAFRTPRAEESGDEDEDGEPPRGAASQLGGVLGSALFRR